MPTHEESAAFLAELRRLSTEDKRGFLEALKDFRIDCDSGHFRAALRVHKLNGQDAWSMTWAEDGRATFRFGKSVRRGKRHIIWLSIGTHSIYKG